MYILCEGWDFPCYGIGALFRNSSIDVRIPTPERAVEASDLILEIET